MRSRFFLGGLCAAVLSLVFVAGPAWAQADVFTGKIGAGSTKVYSITTDTSVIIDILATAAHESTDLDILVFEAFDPDETESRITKTPWVEDDDEDEENEIPSEKVLLRAKSGVLQIEKGVLSVGGATEVIICITNVDGARSRFTALFTTPSATDVGRARVPVQVREIGEFDLEGPTGNSQLAAMQRVVRRHVEAKRSR